MQQFRIEAKNDDSYFVVQLKFLWWWRSGYVHTNYFSMRYQTEAEAKNAIKGYRNRFKKENK